MSRFWEWMHKQAINGTGLDILVIVLVVLAFIFAPAAFLI